MHKSYVNVETCVFILCVIYCYIYVKSTFYGNTCIVYVIYCSCLFQLVAFRVPRCKDCMWELSVFWCWLHPSSHVTVICTAQADQGNIVLFVLTDCEPSQWESVLVWMKSGEQIIIHCLHLFHEVNTWKWGLAYRT